MKKHYIKYYTEENLEQLIDSVGVTKEIVSVTPSLENPLYYLVILKDM